MGRNFGVVDVLRFRAVRIFVSLMVFAAGGVVLTIVEPPTGRANAATITATGDTDGHCTQTVDSSTGVSVTWNGTTCTLTFTAVRAMRTWTVPTGGLVDVFFRIKGGAGGGSYSNPGRSGGSHDGTITSLTAGQSVYISVGSMGACHGSDIPWGGSNGGEGGNNGGCDGGGSTDVRVGGTTASDRKLVAGGGGGDAGSSPSGYSNGNEASGASGGSGSFTGFCNGNNGSSAASGGAGGSTTCRNAGGGGGGYAGGGAAGATSSSNNDTGGDGGSGNSYIAPGFATGSSSYWVNGNTGYSSAFNEFSNSSDGSLELRFYPTTAGTGQCRQTFDNTENVTVTGPTAGECQVTFAYRGKSTRWTVPTGGLTNVAFTIKGGAGSDHVAYDYERSRGAVFSGTITSLSSEGQVFITIGSRATQFASFGGSNGGSGNANGGFYGGGSTDVRVGGSATSNRKIVAGGGGGASVGNDPSTNAADANGATGGSSGYTPYISGSYVCSSTAGVDVIWSPAGRGGTTNCRGGGGGGGGYAGGGGGGGNGTNSGNGGFGGRGSSYIDPTFASGDISADWTSSGANAGANANYTMYSNPGGSHGSLVLTFAVSSSSVSTQPSGGLIGAVLGTQPSVTLERAGNPAPAGVVVTAALGASPTPSGLQNTPALAGTLTATTNGSGIATFTDLKINGPTGSYTLTFTASGYPTATSSSIAMTLGAASALKVSAQPSTSVSGGVVAGSPAVTVVDAGGNAVTSHPVTAVTVTSSTGTIGGTTSANTSSGVATFTAATLAGLVSVSHTLTFSASGLSSATSSTFSVTAGTAAALSIQTQPVGGVAIGTALATQPVVRVVDSAGNVVSSAPTVTATIATGSSFASLGSDFISASSGVATFSGLKVNGAGGNFTLTFTAPGLTSVTSSSFSVSLTSQTITFGALAGKTFGNAAFGISASTTSSLVIAYSSTTPTVCSVTGNTTASAGATGAVVTLLGAGTCTIAANQAGNHQYAAAGQQTQSFAVAQASQSALTLTNASSLSFGDTLTLATSGGSGTGGVSYALVGGAGTAQCVLNTTTGAMTFGAAGTCSVRATKAADTNYTLVQSTTQVLTVARAAQTTSITSTVPAKPLPGGTYAVTATASSGLTPTLVLMSGAGSVCSLSSGTISFLTAGTCVVLATQAGNGNYSPADPEDMQTIVVGSLNQNITFTQPANMDFGDPDAVLTASASSGLAVTLTSQTTSVCTVTGAVVSIVSVGDCEIKATQAGDARYAAASDETRVFEIIAVVANSPTVRSASAASGEISIGFTSPSFDGGAAIVGYRLVATPTAGGTAVTDDSCVTSPCTINGLENGTEYTVTVAAINAAGVGSASAPSPALTPVTNAMAVQDLVSTPGDGSLAISWTTPADLGGGTFTRYEIRIRVSGGSWPGVSTQNVSSSSTTTATLTGLDNGTEYEVQVITITSANASSFEGNTAVVVAIPRRVPSSPRDLAAVKTTPAGVLVSWSTPLSNGGSPITSYTVTFSGGASCGTVTISSSTQAGSCSATGLALGTTFTITVAAVNVAGSSSVVTTTYTTPTFPTTLPAPPTQPPCTTCTRDDGGNDVPGTPATTPAGQKPGTVTLTDGVATVVLSGATGTDAVVNSDGQLEFAIGGKLSAAGSGVLATTTMSTWWNQTASGTGTANSSGVATAEVTLPTGTTTGVASVRVDAVSSLGAHRAFYFAVKVVAASSGTSSDTSSTSGGSSTSGTTTTTVAGGSGGTTTTGGGGDGGDDTTTQDVSTPRKPKKSGTFDPKSGENEMLSSTGKVSKPKTTETRSGLTIEGGGVKVGLSPVKGTKMARNASGQMVISGTGTIAISKSGLKPGSKVVVWLRPSMKRLAVKRVKADGTVDFNVTLPADTEAGEHTLQIDMVNAKGNAVSMASGFSLSTNRMPVTGSNSAGGLVPAFMLLLLGLGFLAGRRRLRVSPSL